MKKGLLLWVTLLLVLSCSTSNESASVYDNMLSNTTWAQSYIMPGSEGNPDEIFQLPEEIRERLKEEFLSTSTVIDTVWNVTHVKGKLTLLFGEDDECHIEDESEPVGTYKIRTRSKMEYHYPDQSHSYTDDTGEFLYEVIVVEDSLFFKTSYIGNSMDSLINEVKTYIGHFYEYDLKNISDPYPCSAERDTMYFHFMRSDHNIVLNGDKTLTGVINEDYNEINFNELGTMYLE